MEEQRDLIQKTLWEGEEQLQALPGFAAPLPGETVSELLAGGRR